MGFVKSQQELDQYYSLGVRKFEGASMMGVMYLTRPEIVSRLLPPPLEPADTPGALIFIAEYPQTNLGPGYRETALFLSCKYNGETGNYCLSMPIDNEPRMHNGRDIFGLPKKLATIHFERSEQQVHGWAERNGVRFIELQTTLSASLPGLPPQGPSFLFKAMPRVDLTPGFDGPVLLVRQQTDVALRSCEVGVPEVMLTPSETDPWAEVEVVTVTVGFHIVSDNVMKPGEVVAEVDPEAFLPHYFKMTDFSTGK